MVYIMPRVIFDSFNLANMEIFSSFHEHANGDVSEIQGRVKDVQVMFLKRSVVIDFSIMKPNQGNIVLGRDFLRAMKGFIDVGKGRIRLRGKAKGMYPFRKRNKIELSEDPFEIFGDPYESEEFGFDFFPLCLAQRRKESACWEATQFVFPSIFSGLDICYYGSNIIVSLFSSFVPCLASDCKKVHKL